jgi:hypothetical protein
LRCYKPGCFPFEKKHTEGVDEPFVSLHSRNTAGPEINRYILVIRNYSYTDLIAKKKSKHSGRFHETEDVPIEYNYS